LDALQAVQYSKYVHKSYALLSALGSGQFLRTYGLPLAVAVRENVGKKSPARGGCADCDHHPVNVE